MTTPKKPNIILINCDDLGYGDLECYGSTVNDTPYLDRMAAEGIRFTDFYMASPVSSPSRCAMMTGCYPPRIGCGDFDGRGVLFPGDPTGLNPEEVTIASQLKKAGYATKLIGKWHCGDQPEFLPTRHGFDSYYGLPYSNDMGRQMRPDGSITHFPPLPLIRDEDVIEEQPDQTTITSRYVEESVRFIRENKESPFFLYLAHMHVHLPHYPPECFLKKSRNGRYGGAVAAIDWSVGVLMNELQSLGLDESTLMVFTSDNGSRVKNEGGSNDPLRGTKCTTWEGGMRLPCIMRWPGTLPAGKTTSALAASIDFFPTFSNLAGVPCSKDRIIDGVDLTDSLFSDISHTPRDTFFYYNKNALQAVRFNEWKLWLSRDGNEVKELYNLAHDIGETTNVYEQHPDVVEALVKKAQECREDIGDTCKKIEGKNCRPTGRVENPDTLTHYDPTHPYVIAEYDLTDMG